MTSDHPYITGLAERRNEVPRQYLLVAKLHA